MILYHNTRCSTSRAALQLLKDKGIEPEIVEYMKDPLTPAELDDILTKLEMSAENLVRKKETVWKEQFDHKELTAEEIILAMIEYPQLMERPILINEKKARIGRPPEKILEII